MEDEIRQNIFEQIDRERKYQVGRWGNEADDTKNMPNDWVSYIASYSTRWLAGEFAPYSPETVIRFRRAMIQAAAIAVAAVESLDRQQAANGKTFYTK
jgi:hypothetical protein